MSTTTVTLEGGPFDGRTIELMTPRDDVWIAGLGDHFTLIPTEGETINAVLDAVGGEWHRYRRVEEHLYEFVPRATPADQ